MTRPRRGSVGLLASVSVLAFAFAFAFAFAGAGLPGAVLADHRTETVALPAEDAVEAAIAWSERRFPEGASAALLATTADFADALASGLGQGSLQAPLLLTATEALDPRARAELERLEATEVHVLGGPAAVSEEVEAALGEMGLTVTRHAGATRVETAIALAKAQAPEARAALVARAFGDGSSDPTRAWADSLAAGALAAGTGRPLLLTATDELPASLAAYLQESSITGAVIVGGAAAVSDRVMSQLQALGLDTERVSGPNRAATAVALAARRGLPDAASAGAIHVVDGQDTDGWTAGLPAAGPAAVERAPIVIAAGDVLPPETEEYLAGAADAPPPVVCAPLLSRRACDLAAGAAGYDALHENATASDAPELVRAELLASEEDGGVLVRYVFDEDVRLGSGGAGRFRLAPPDTSAVAVAAAAAVSQDDAKAVDARFAEDHLSSFATLALADAGAVEDAKGVASPDGSAELSDAAPPPGRTRRPDLVGAEAADGVLALRFDAPVDTAIGGNVAAVLADGSVVTGGNATLADGGRTVRVAMAGLDPAEVRRAVARPGAVMTRQGSNPLSAVPVGDGRTDAPDLVDVIPRPSADQVDFVFDADVVPLADGGEATGFRLRYEDGTEVTSADGTVQTGARTIRAQFPDGAANRLVVAAAVAEGAVVGTDDVAGADDARGLAREFSFAESFGPRLVEAERRVEEVEGVTAAIAGDTTVRLTFDRAVTQVSTVRIAAIDRDGARVPLSGCTVEPGIAQDTVTCDVPPAPVGQEARALVAVTIAYDAVRAAESWRTGTEPASGFGRTVAMPAVPATLPFEPLQAPADPPPATEEPTEPEPTEDPSEPQAQ